MMSAPFDPFTLCNADVTQVQDVLMTNPTAPGDLETYWATLPRIRGVPLRKDVDPAAMPTLLEDSFILERVAPGVGRIRVAGRNVGRLLGVEPRGLPLTAAFLSQSRTDISRHLEAVFTSPGLVELTLESPRAVGQPLLQGKIIMLPLRDDHGRISRILGVLVMSGLRGVGGRRFVIKQDAPVRFEPILGLHVVKTRPMPPLRPVAPPRPSWAIMDNEKAEARPALRLIVSNP